MIRLFLFIIALVLGALLLVTGVIADMLSYITASLAIVVLVFGILYFFTRPAEKRGFGYLREYRESATAIGFIAAGLAFLNWLCAHIEWRWWLEVWDRHQTLFWITQFAILFSFTVFLFTKNGIAKLMGYLVLIMCILGWFKVNDFGDFLVRTTRPKQRFVETTVLIPKQEIREVKVAEIISFDNVNFDYRFNHVGEFKPYKLNTKLQFNPRKDIDMEIRPANENMLVRLRKWN